MICTPGELHAMDYGVHMHVMEEWNEEYNFGWQDATVVLAGYYDRVLQTDKDSCLYVATYIAGGEGDLVSLRVYTSTPQRKIGNSVAIMEMRRIDHTIGTEMWWSNRQEDSSPLKLSGNRPTT